MLIQKHFNPPPQDQIQKDIANLMPWVITFTLSKFPSGLVIYWTFSNLISVLQQYWIMRSMNVPVYLFSKDEALAYESSHTNKVTEATEKAKQSKDAKVIDAEVVEEALFDKPKDPK
jgi:YidC/Oxa1 family membrane protein insertase